MGFSPRKMPSGMGGRYGAPLFENRGQYGAPLFENPRTMSDYGRRGYSVPEGYIEVPGQPKRKRKAYRVKKMRNTSGMAAAQKRFKKAAKKCGRVAKQKGARAGAFRVCMRKALKGKSKR
jgi:hypothetical protein